MKCVTCGLELGGVANYCHSCGSQVMRGSIDIENQGEGTSGTREEPQHNETTNPQGAGSELVKKPLTWIVLSAVLLGVLLVLDSGLSKSAAYKIGYENWNAPISGLMYTDMRWGGLARTYCAAAGRDLRGFSGTELEDYIQGCLDGFNNANP